MICSLVHSPPYRLQRSNSGRDRRDGSPDRKAARTTGTTDRSSRGDQKEGVRRIIIDTTVNTEERSSSQTLESSRPRGSAPDRPTGDEKAVEVCNKWLAGKCKRGKNCRYLHQDPATLTLADEGYVYPNSELRHILSELHKPIIT